MVMYILYTSHQQNTLDGDVYIIHITTTEHFRWGCIYYTHHTNRTAYMVMYILYASKQQNNLDGDVYIIHITTTEHFRW